MAVMADAERFQCWSGLMRWISRNSSVTTVTKTDLRAAVDAVDQWCEDNQSSFNQSLPVAARTGLSAQQKALLLIYVIARRSGYDADV